MTTKAAVKKQSAVEKFAALLDKLQGTFSSKKQDYERTLAGIGARVAEGADPGKEAETLRKLELEVEAQGAAVDHTRALLDAARAELIAVQVAEATAAVDGYMKKIKATLTVDNEDDLLAGVDDQIFSLEKDLQAVREIWVNQGSPYMSTPERMVNEHKIANYKRILNDLHKARNTLGRLLSRYG